MLLNVVVNKIVSNLRFWVTRYEQDGLQLDAVVRLLFSALLLPSFCFHLTPVVPHQ